jgi:hypothetical protein
VLKMPTFPHKDAADGYKDRNLVYVIAYIVWFCSRNKQKIYLMKEFNQEGRVIVETLGHFHFAVYRRAICEDRI